jgi:pimeloyl-ACP methyl ester carboxylesterase
MPHFVISRDGTKIAFDRIGQGPALIVIGGLFCDRKKMQPLAEAFSRRFGVINYDRRGRGESLDSDIYAVQREIEDIEALIEEDGGTALIYGHSSGAGLALEAAASGLPVDGLILHEPPYGGDDIESQDSARQLAEQIRAAVERGDHEGAISTFFEAMGLPDEMVQEFAGDPDMKAIAHTMPYDFEVMGEFSGGGIPAARAKSISCPTLVLAGGASPQFFQETAERLGSLIPGAQLETIEGQDHEAPPEAVAPHVLGWLQRI